MEKLKKKMIKRKFLFFKVNLEQTKKKSVQFDEKVEVQNVEPVEEQEPLKIDESKLNRCIELLEDADPTGDRPDTEELLQLEGILYCIYI